MQEKILIALGMSHLLSALRDNKVFRAIDSIVSHAIYISGSVALSKNSLCFPHHQHLLYLKFQKHA